MHSIKAGFIGYFDFLGKMNISDYWRWMVFILIMFVLLQFLDGVLLLPSLGYEHFPRGVIYPASIFFQSIIIVPGISATVRRLNDAGKPGHYFFVIALPLVGIFILMYWLLQPQKNTPKI